MSIGSQIAHYRKEKGLTQETLAQQINVTNQAVSKWESDQCCPDIQMLPKLADIFGVSVDALFDREAARPQQDDDAMQKTTETLCGKICSTCALKEASACPGCKVGPGNQNNGECEIAKCCRTKGHTDCTSCTFSAHCGPLLSRRDAPVQRKKKQDAENFLAAQLHNRAAFLGRWLIALLAVLFLEVVAFAFVVQNFKGLEDVRYPALVVGISFSAAYGIVLLWLSKQEEKYRTAGICMLVAAAINLITVTVFRNDRILPPLFFLFSSLIMVAAILFEYKGHIAVLTGFDHAMATRWETLLFCHVGLSGMLLAHTVLVERLTGIGEFIYIAVGFFWYIAVLMHMIYIGFTIKQFRRYANKKG